MGMLLSSLWRRLFTYKEFKICLVGLDNAGKTTILFQLHMGEVVETQPTIGSNVETVVHNNVHFNVWDLAGQDSLRQGWSTYFQGTHAVIVVVDSTDRARISTVKQELFKLLENVDLQNAVFLVFANKQDCMKNNPAIAAAATTSSSTPAPLDPTSTSSSSTSSSSSTPPVDLNNQSGCMTAAQIAEQLNLQTIKNHPWHIQACCALTGEGLYEGIDWVTHAVTKS